MSREHRNSTVEEALQPLPQPLASRSVNISSTVVALDQARIVTQPADARPEHPRPCPAALARPAAGVLSPASPCRAEMTGSRIKTITILLRIYFS